MMDILDTIGDWFQFIGVLLAFPFIINKIYKPITLSGFSIITTLVINGVLWISVYDYDLVLGYLIGAGLTATANWRKVLDRPASRRYSNFDPMTAVVPAVAITSTLTVGVMLAKIILFW